MTETSKGPEATSLGHYPTGPRWEFDAEVARVFEDMLRRSIPQLDVMRGLVSDLACRYYRPGTSLVDLGASRGDAAAAFREAAIDRGGFSCIDLVEVSPPMAAICRERFRDDPRIRVHELDLRTGYPRMERCGASVTLLVLTLQFVPIEHRIRILSDVWRTTVPGGAVILVEKVIGGDPTSASMLVEEYQAMKRRNGYTQEEIDRKAASLEGVLVPVTARWNEDLLRGAGFRSVECFWRCLSFAGWVGVRA